MRRIHVFEIEDQSWCPAPVRRAATDNLRFAAKMNRVYDGEVPVLRRAIERAAGPHARPVLGRRRASRPSTARTTATSVPA